MYITGSPAVLLRMFTTVSVMNATKPRYRPRMVYPRREITLVPLPHHCPPPPPRAGAPRLLCVILFGSRSRCFTRCRRCYVQGIAPEISRGVLSAALMLMVKEKIHSAVKSAIVGRRAIVAAK